MKVTAIIEARMKSTRLPGKNLRPILGRPMLEMLIERLKRCRMLDGIVVATTPDVTDDVIEVLCGKLGVSCFRGSMEDVLDRVLRAAQSVDADVIVEITGDCPLTDPGIVDQAVEFFLGNKYDYVSNVLQLTYPLGIAVQVFPVKVLEEVSRLTQDPADREHVSLYIYEHPERYALHNIESGLPEKYRNYRLTVDTSEDFALICAIFEALYPDKPAFDLGDMLAFLDSNPALLELNRGIQQRFVR